LVGVSYVGDGKSVFFWVSLSRRAEKVGGRFDSVRAVLLCFFLLQQRLVFVI